MTSANGNAGEGAASDDECTVYSNKVLPELRHLCEIYIKFILLLGINGVRTSELDKRRQKLVVVLSMLPLVLLLLLIRFPTDPLLLLTLFGYLLSHTAHEDLFAVDICKVDDLERGIHLRARGGNVARLEWWYCEDRELPQKALGA